MPIPLFQIALPALPVGAGALPLAAVDLQSPLMWGVVIGWILSVVIHEFAHGLVAHWGGDYTIQERGGLTLNPIQYIDPFGSILLPVIFLLMGGVPLPGGVTYVRTDLLRSNAWRTAVSLAGPAANLLIFIVIVALMHPAFGLFDLTKPVEEWSNAQVFAGALASLQVIGAIFNLVPLPPLDGFNAIAPYLPQDLVEKVRQPPFPLLSLLVLFFIVAPLPAFWQIAGNVVYAGPKLLGLPPETGGDLFRCMRFALFKS